MAASSTSAYDRHLQRASSYVRFYGGAPPSPPNFRSERDILEQNHQFVRDEDRDVEVNEEKLLARQYYSSLFREYALIDLSRWRELKVALRWRTKAEVLAGQGQFTCGCLNCSGRNRGDIDQHSEKLQTFELNFAYTEDGAKKNALVKVCVCRRCSRKLRKAQKSDDDQTESHKRTRRHQSNSHQRSESPLRVPKAAVGGRAS